MGARQSQNPRRRIFEFLTMQLLWLFPKQEIGQALLWFSPPESCTPVAGLTGGLPGQLTSWVATQGQQGPYRLQQGPDDMLGLSNPEPLMT